LYQFTRRVIKQCSNCRGISLLSNSYKILSNILLSRLSPYIDEAIRDHQCEFRRNRSTTDQILEKKWEYKETVHQVFVDFEKAYDAGIPSLHSSEKQCFSESREKSVILDQSFRAIKHAGTH
jgi:hypothetical protein